MRWGNILQNWWISLIKLRELSAIIICICLSNCALVEEENIAHYRLFNYWAEWCLPCIEEIPVLNCLNQRKDVTVVGIYSGGVVNDSEVLKEVTHQFGIEYESKLNSFHKENEFLPEIEGLPMTVLLDSKDQVKHVFYGAQTIDVFEEKLLEVQTKDQVLIEKEDLSSRCSIEHS